MTLNAKADKIRKLMIIELNFEKISKTFDSEISKLQPVNLSKTSRDTLGVFQEAADSLESF